MALLRRRNGKRLGLLALAAAFTMLVAKLLLPPDTPVFLLTHWWGVCVRHFFRPTDSINDWYFTSEGRHPVSYEKDVGLLIKTGYGTRERLGAQLEGLGLGEWDPERAVVVADFGVDNGPGQPVIKDAVGELMEYSKAFGLSDSPRFEKYRGLQKAIQAGNEKEAIEIGKKYGWELDALKFIWSIGALYETLPKKEWYIILDDDSYLIRETLMPFLSNFDPSVPHYIGNAVGHYTARFAHGGSAILLTRAAVDALYHSSPEVVHAANVKALNEKYGDSLLASTLQHVGIFIDERFNHLFNGEPPVETRIWGDRFCSPLASFHELKKPEQARYVRQRMSTWRGPMVWSDVWEVFGGEDVRGFGERPMREGWDFVGRLKGELGSSSRGKGTAERCMRICMTDGKGCLAWKWDAPSQECYTTPWMIVGMKADNIVSGVNGEWAAELRARCTNKVGRTIA